MALKGGLLDEKACRLLKGSPSRAYCLTGFNYLVQVKAAVRCEEATGPAVRPDCKSGAGNSMAPADEEEVDPLDAFMAEMKELEKASDAQAPSARAAGKPAAERFDDLDPAADFLEVGMGTALCGGLTVK